jgi:RhoGAP domain
VTSRADVTCRIVQYEAQNSMSIGNLSIVFGPTLFPPTAPHGANGQDGLVGATIQNKVRQNFYPESGLLKVGDIFPGD